MADEARLRKYLEKAAIDLRQARNRIRELEHDAHAPIAILGMGCRFPGGVDSPEALWEMLANEVDAVGPFPDDRGWDLKRLYDPDPDNPGTTYVRAGGFIAGVGDFDPAFFGVGPREATTLDPQQRLLLEVTWEALEDAGIDPASLRGGSAGIFVGAGGGDYSHMLAAKQLGGGSLALGGFASALAGRLSYTLDLGGPAVTVDTACSSSLVSLHLAIQALRTGECGLAMASGVMVMSTTTGIVDFTSSRALAADGRCKAFANAADGLGLAEGAGVLVLERLADAEAKGREVLAVVRGSAVNQDGASNGITAPNGPSQERVIRQALANAGVGPADVDAVEAHGTGTPLGDPIEAGALLATYGGERERPLLIGSIKSNFGHPAAAAGVAGVIKMVMALREEALPKTLHVDRPSDNIDWEAGAIEILTEARPWAAGDRVRRAGVSSFGASGTNAHVVLEEAPAAQAGDAEGAGGEGESGPAALPVAPLVISAKSEPALRDAARDLAARIEADPDLDPADVAHALATRRPRFARRAAVVASDRERLLERLASLVAGSEAETGGVHADVARAGGNPVFVFGGWGSQWDGMVAELIDASPFFAECVRECDEVLSSYCEWSIEDVLRRTPGAPGVNDRDVGPQALFAATVALAKLWIACGVEPAAVLGHSQGEVVAAHVAGGLSLEDAACVAIERHRLFFKLIGAGAMASIGMSAADLEPRLERFDGEISLAALNGPAASIVSGSTEPLDELLAECVAEGARARMVPGAILASHSRQVEALREEMLEALTTISPRSGRLPFYSTVTGGQIDTAELDAEYWYRNLRQTVLFEPVVRGLVEDGCRALLEVGPHPALAVPLRETVEDCAGGPETAAVLGTLRRGEGGSERFALSLGEAWAAGAEIDWDAFFAGSGAKAVKLPTYPFQRSRHWLDGMHAIGDAGGAGLLDLHHPLLAAAIDSPAGDGLQLSGLVSIASEPWLAAGTVLGEVVVPAAAHVELALAAARTAGLGGVERLELETPLVLSGAGSVQLRVGVGGAEVDGPPTVEVHSRPRPEADVEPEPWTRHAVGTLAAEPTEADAADTAFARGAWPPEGAEELDPELVYDRLAEAGIELDAAARCLRGAWRDDDGILLEVGLGDGVEATGDGFRVHPLLLEAAATASLELAGEDGEALTLPRRWGAVRAFADAGATLRVRATVGADGMELLACDATGELVFAADSIVGEAPDPGAVSSSWRRRSLYRVEWSAAEQATPGPAPTVAALGQISISDFEGERYPDVAALLEAVEAGAPAPDVALAEPLPGTGTGEDLAAGARAGARAGLDLAKVWAGAAALAGCRLVVLTKGAVSSSPDEAPALGAAPIWGLFSSAASEFRGRFALLDRDTDEVPPAVLASAIVAGADEPQLAIRAGEVLAPRLARPGQGEFESSPAPIDSEGTILVTGALTGAGAAVARHMADTHGARRLLLVDADSEDGEAAELVAELAALGTEATVVACDISDRAGLKDLIESIPTDHPLVSVVHAASVVDNATIESLDGERVDAVMRPKVDGAWHLHELTRDLPLSEFLLFSSGAGLVGGVAQANFAAANVFLDALAAHRRAAGLPAISIAWGDWAVEARALEGFEDLDRLRFERSGVIPFTVAEGLDLLDAIRAADEPLVAPVGLEPAILRAQASVGMLPPLFRGLVRQSDATEEGDFRARLAGIPPERRQAAVLELVRGQVAAVLGYSSGADVDPELFLQELGLDSLSLVELRNRIKAATGVQISIGALSDRPTVNGAAVHLLEQLEAGTGLAEATQGATSISFTALLAEARANDTLGEFVELLMGASRFRPGFSTAAESDWQPRPVLLAEGSATSPLVLLPSLGPISGVHEYVRLARALAGKRRVYSLALPGFGPDEALPADADAAVAVLAEAVRAIDPRPIVGGHSSGGLLAQAVAARLEQSGEAVEAVLLLDTYPLRSPLLERLLPLMMMRDEAEGAIAADDSRLLAMGAYRRIFAEWETPEVSARTVLVRAEEPAWEDDSSAWQSTWESPHVSTEARGNHFSMMTDHAGGTAAAIEEVLEAETVNGSGGTR